MAATRFYERNVHHLQDYTSSQARKPQSISRNYSDVAPSLVPRKTLLSDSKLSRYTPRRRLGREKCNPYSFFSSALDGSGWPASRPGSTLPRRKKPRYRLDTRHGGLQSRPGSRCWRKTTLLLPGIQPRSSKPYSRHPTEQTSTASFFRTEQL
jgi:hypothetical protein